MCRRVLLRPAIGTTLVLLVPLVMTILDRNKPLGEGWRWNLGAFVFFGALLLSAGALYEWIALRRPRAIHRFAAATAITVVELGIWAELAVHAVSRGLQFIVG